MFATKSIIALLTAAAVVSAAPTATVGNKVSRTVLTGVTHSVVAGLGGLHFDPENVVAEIGDIVEWHFLPKNHSVVQSSFGAPCVPESATSFFSGFQPIMEGQAPNVFQIVVTDNKPIWYYCAQTNGNHCQAGMAGVINQNFNSPNTLAAYKANAALTGTSVIPPVIQGGFVIPNPNPLGGF
ncbi:extracellular serine-rich protein [Xylogone sp. PMI_703]|nr:extracellular serine-rich protein [Xylogone sp. PMI_703]